MSDEIITRQAVQLEVPTLQQNGEKNVNVNNQTGGIVNFNHSRIQATVRRK